MPGNVRDKLWRLIEEERSRGRPPQRKAPQGGPTAEERFAPVREAAQQIAAELGKYDELSLTINPESVWIDLYDKHICFSFDPASGRFVVDELGYAWLEPELREDSVVCDDADACIDALFRACARYVALAEAIRAMEPKPV